MDATLQTINLQLPSSDMQFLKELAKKYNSHYLNENTLH